MEVRTSNAVFFIALSADCLQLIAYRRTNGGARKNGGSGDTREEIIFLISTNLLWITSEQERLKSFRGSLVSMSRYGLGEKSC